jgi:hypothetical protein
MQPTQPPAHLSIVINRTRRLNLITISLAVVWWLLIGLTMSPEVDDFHYFRRGALDQLHTGDPYSSLPEWKPSATPQPDARPDKVVAYLYPPLLAYLIQPLALASPLQGQIAWFLINSGALAGLIWLCIRLSGSALARQYWGLVVLGTLVAPPTRLCLQLGQLGILIALLIVGSFALARRHAAFSGLLLALASVVKLYPALLGIYYLIRGSRRVVYGSAVCAAALLALSVLFYGASPYINFVRKVLVSGYYPYAAEFNISLVGYWDRLLAASLYAVPLINAPVLARLVAVVCSIAVLGVCFWSTRSAGEQMTTQLQFGVWLCGMLLLSPINGAYNMVLLLFPLLVVLRYLELYRDHRTRNWVVVAGALSCWPPAWTDWHPTLYNNLHVGFGLLVLTPALYGLVLWLGLLARLARQPLHAAAQPDVAQELPLTTR